MSAQLPSLKNVFPSATAFKLAVHRAALAGGFEVKALTGSDRFVKMICRLHSDATSSHVGYEDPCTLLLKASSSGQLDGTVRVIYSFKEHSCDPTVRAERKDSAELWEAKKIAELERAVQHQENLKARKDRDDASASGSSEDEDTGERDVELGRQDSHTNPHPPLSGLKKEIAVLLKGPPLLFPSPNEPFPSLRQITLHLHAYAQQHGFTIYRSSRYTLTDAVRFKCSQNHARYDGAAEGRCKCTFFAEKDDEGIWRVVESSLEHTHALSKPTSTAGTKRARSSSTSSAEDGPPQPASPFNHFFPPSSSSVSSHTLPAHPSTSSPKVCSGPSPIQASPASSPFSLAPKPFPRQLRSFLAALPSQPDGHLDKLFNSLLSLGIASIADLTSLILLEEESLLFLFELLQSREVPKTTLAAFLKAVEEARGVAMG